MDDVTRAVLLSMTQETRDGFARMERYFELMLEQYRELRAEVREVTAEVRAARADAAGLRSDLRSSRDGGSVQRAEG